MRILYKYLTTSLFPRHSEPEVRMCEQKSGGIIDKRAVQGKIHRGVFKGWEKGDDCSLVEKKD